MAKLERVKQPNLGCPEIVSSKHRRVAMHGLCQVPLAQKIENGLRRVGKPFCPKCRRLVGKKGAAVLALDEFLKLPELETQFPGARFISLQRVPSRDKFGYAKPDQLPAGIKIWEGAVAKPNGYSDTCYCSNCMDYRSAKKKKDKAARSSEECPPVEVLNYTGAPAYEFKRQGILVSLPSTHYSEAAAQEILSALQTAPAHLPTGWVAGTQSENGSFGISKEKMQIYRPEGDVDQIVEGHRREENPCREAYSPWAFGVAPEQPNLEEPPSTPEQKSLSVDYLHASPNEVVLKRKGVSVHLSREHYSPRAISAILQVLEQAHPAAKTQALAKYASDQEGIAAGALYFTYGAELLAASEVPPLPVKVLKTDRLAHVFQRGEVLVYLPKTRYGLHSASLILQALREAPGNEDTCWIARRRSEGRDILVPGEHLRFKQGGTEGS